MSGAIFAMAFREASRFLGLALALTSTALLVRIDVLGELGRPISRRTIVVAGTVTVAVSLLLLYRFERLVS
jgi:Kef-type K+ transport system membrane component KefB